MNLITLAVVVIAVAVVVQVVALIPAVLQLKKTLMAAEVFIRDMDGSLKTLIEEEIRPSYRALNSMLKNLEGATKGVKDGVEKVDDVLEAFRAVGGTVRSVSGILDTAVRNPVIKLASCLTGIRVGVETLVNALRHREQKEVQ